MEMMTQSDEHWMEIALTQAEAAAGRGEVPVGAVLVASGSANALCSDGNRILEWRDPTAHAEINVIRAGAQILNNERLVGCTLYVTLEPCAMCAGAIAMARIARVVFAASDPKGGAVIHGPKFFEQPTCHHRTAVTHLSGTPTDASAALLKEFFRARR